MKTPIEMLNAMIEMQEANYGNATKTHLALSTLAREAKDVVKNCSIPVVVGRSEQLVHCTDDDHNARRFFGGEKQCGKCGHPLR